MSIVPGIIRRAHALAHRAGVVRDPFRRVRDRLERLLDKRIPGVFEQSTVPGMSIAVRFDSGPLIERQFGAASIETREPVTPGTSFLVLSLSKSITAMMALLLAQRGVLSLDTPVLSLAGDFAIPPERLGGVDPSLITVRRVLSHTSGLNRTRFDWRVDPTPIPAIDMLHAVDGSDDPLAITGEVGRGPVYSSGAYLLLQHAMERVTGRAFAPLADELVLRPLGMNDSTFDPSRAGPVARAHVDRTAIRPRTWPTCEASGGLISTPRDLTRFFVALLPRSGSPHPGLSPASAALMTSPAASDPKLGACSLGLFLHRRRSDTEFFHAAFKEGWWSWGEGLVRRRAAFAICTNADSGKELVRTVSMLIRQVILDAALEIRPGSGSRGGAGPD